MSSIHYFPRYSQKENMVTNNTMLLFQRLYHHSTAQFNQFLNTLFEQTEHSSIESLDTTISFEQQVRSTHSIPDAIISQKSFKIIIETKLYGQENMQQIKNHCQAFENEDTKIFLWINKEKMKDDYYQKLVHTFNEINESLENKISIVATTFKDICTCFKEILTPFDQEMTDLIEDFEAFCYESRLIENADTKMRVVTAGTTLKQNLTYNLYYAPKERSYQNHKYLGLYHQKAVRAIGQFTCSADISYDESTDQLTVEQVQFGDLTEERKNAVKQVMIEAKEKYGYMIMKNHRFFFVDQFYETKYKKPTKGGLMGTKYFDLADIEGYRKEMTTEEIAALLKEREW